MCYIVLRQISDLCVQTRKTVLIDAIKSAEELIERGIEKSLIVCKEIDNTEKQKLDWSQPTWLREYVCNVC